jgi:predicted nucleic acid-binding protein
VDLVFLDTNVLLRHLLGDIPEQSARATAMIERIERLELRARLADTVIFETVFTLSRTYRQPREKIREALVALLGLRGMVLPGKRIFRRAFDLYVDLNLPFADAYHAALMERLEIRQVVSFDKDFDRVPGLERIEP